MASNIIPTNQIAKIQTNKKLIAFYDKLHIAPIEHYAQIHAKCWMGHGYRTNGYKVGWKNDVQGREHAYSLLN